MTAFASRASWLRVRPTAFAAGSANQERWVSAIARYRNEQNYYCAHFIHRTEPELILKAVSDVVEAARSEQRQ